MRTTATMRPSVIADSLPCAPSSDTARLSAVPGQAGSAVATTPKSLNGATTGGDARPPLSLRISITDRCQLRCLYCMPPEGLPLGTHGDILAFEDIVAFVRLVQADYRLTKVHLTGGEPLVRRGVVHLTAMLAREGLEDLALTTNGQLLAELAPDLKRAGLRRVNVSLDSLRADTYARLTCGGRLDRTLAGIEAALGAGLTPLKFNAVVMRGINDVELPALARFALDRGCAIRFLELMPIGCARPLFQEHYLSAADMRARLAADFHLTPLPYEPGRSSRYCAIADDAGRQGRVGFITPESQPFCSDCHRLRLTADGQLHGCLALEHRVAVGPLLRAGPQASPALVRQAVDKALSRKRRTRDFARATPMAAIGG